MPHRIHRKRTSSVRAGQPASGPVEWCDGRPTLSRSTDRRPSRLPCDATTRCLHPPSNRPPTHLSLGWMLYLSVRVSDRVCVCVCVCHDSRRISNRTRALACERCKCSSISGRSTPCGWWTVIGSRSVTASPKARRDTARRRPQSVGPRTRLWEPLERKINLLVSSRRGVRWKLYSSRRCARRRRTSDVLW